MVNRHLVLGKAFESGRKILQENRCVEKELVDE